MYETFYGFKEKPFSLVPDPEFLYLSDKHRMALALLEYGLINQAGFTVITGNIGTGKTTLVRHLLQGLDDEFRVGLITNTHREFGELLHWILMAFDLDYKGKDKVESYHLFVDFLIGEYAQNRRTVLIVDEAQNLSPDTLEELRMLSNVNADKHQVLQTILVGQQELRDTLRRPDLMQFAQRITADYHLKPLNQAETCTYIEHRLTVAGGDKHLFDPAASQLVYKYSNGIPRLINLLCDTALVYGYAEQRHKIPASLIDELAKEKQAGGIFPNVETPQPATPGMAHDTTPPQDTPVDDFSASMIDEPPAIAEEQTILPKPANTAAATNQLELESSPGPEHMPADALRVAIIANQPDHGQHLASILSQQGLVVLGHHRLGEDLATHMETHTTDVVLVDLDEHIEDDYDQLESLLEQWGLPALFNDSLTTSLDMKKRDASYQRKLAAKIQSLADISRRESRVIASPNT